MAAESTRLELMGFTDSGEDLSPGSAAYLGELRPNGGGGDLGEPLAVDRGVGDPPGSPAYFGQVDAGTGTPATAQTGIGEPPGSPAYFGRDTQ